MRHSEQLRKLAEYMLKGCEITPKQAFEKLADPESTCAIGAIVEGRYGPRSMRDSIWEDYFLLQKEFSVLSVSGIFTELPIKREISCMNDYKKLTREEIAFKLLAKADEMEGVKDEK